MLQAASSMGVGGRLKRETALVSYNNLDATLTCNINDTPPSFEYCWLPVQGRKIEIQIRAENVTNCWSRTVGDKH